MKKIKYLLMVLLLIPFTLYADSVEVKDINDYGILYSNGTYYYRHYDSYYNSTLDDWVYDYFNYTVSDVVEIGDYDYEEKYLLSNGTFIDGEEHYDNVKDYVSYGILLYNNGDLRCLYSNDSCFHSESSNYLIGSNVIKAIEEFVEPII